MTAKSLIMKIDVNYVCLLYYFPILKKYRKIIAIKIATKLKDFNQQGVAFYGDPNGSVSTVGLRAGTVCDPIIYAELNPDLWIAIDDTIKTCIQTTYAEDSGKFLVVINHRISEEMGMRLLSE